MCVCQCVFVCTFALCFFSHNLHLDWQKWLNRENLVLRSQPEWIPSSSFSFKGQCVNENTDNHKIRPSCFFTSPLTTIFVPSCYSILFLRFYRDMWLSPDATWAGDYETGKHWSFAFPPSSGRVGARAHFSASEPWLFKRAPAVLITLSLGTLMHTDAGAHICECTAALVDRGKEALACSCWLWRSETAGREFVIGCWDSRAVPFQPNGLRGHYCGNDA